MANKILMKKNNESINKVFNKDISIIFAGNEDKYGGEMKKGWILTNGFFAVLLDRESNQLKYYDYKGENEKAFFIHPRLGNPFSHEFSNKEADKVEFYEEEDSACMRAIYISSDFPDIHLISVIKLKDNGVVENYYEVYNLGEKTVKDLVLSHSFVYQLQDMYLPYNNRTDITRKAIVWPEGKTPELNGCFISINFNIGNINCGECCKTGSLFLHPEIS